MMSIPAAIQLNHWFSVSSIAQPSDGKIQWDATYRKMERNMLDSKIEKKSATSGRIIRSSSSHAWSTSTMQITMIMGETTFTPDRSDFRHATCIKKFTAKVVLFPEINNEGKENTTKIMTMFTNPRSVGRFVRQTCSRKSIQSPNYLWAL